MSIETKHYYRFEYLRSEHWKTLRIAKLAEVDACCEKCGKRDLSNDVHHLVYRNLYDVKTSDLVCLCRDCHDLAHDALEEFRAFIHVPKNPAKIFKRTLKAMRRLEVARKLREPTHNETFCALRLAKKQRDRPPDHLLSSTL